MPPKDNKRKNAGQTGTTQPNRQTTEQEHEPSEAIESSGEQPSPLSKVPEEPGPSQTSARQPMIVKASIGQQPDSETGKIFNDPIHGHIEIPPLCVKIIDTPQFQRLRSIKQVGGTYFVYPGASHNRFEHSIGVCHLAGQFASALRVGQSELNITDDDVLCVQIAGLCHDLGHGPFSHMFDGRFLPSIGNKTKHESLSVKMFQHLVEKNELDTDFSVYFKEDLNTNKKFITELIDTKDETQGWPYEGRGQEKRFLYEIVANKRNGIDVDKWDYFARDCHMLGIKNSFDHARCLKLARVVEVDGEKQICFRDKEVENLYEMFHTRIRLYRQAYEHCVGNTVEIMISEAMKKANHLIRIPGEIKILEAKKMADELSRKLGENKISEAEKMADERSRKLGENKISEAKKMADELSRKLEENKILEAKKMADELSRKLGENKTFSISGTLEDMNAYEKLTDSIVDQIMCTTDESLEESREILMNVKNRKLYVCLGHALSSKKMTDEAVMKRCVEILKKNGSMLCENETEEAVMKRFVEKLKKNGSMLRENDVTIDTEEAVMKRYVEILKKKGSMLRENDVTIDVVKLNYGMKDKNPIDHVRFYKKDSPDNATEIDKNEVSFLLPEMFAEKQIRFYCKKNDEKSLIEANDALKDWCQENKCSLINGSHCNDPVKSTDKRTASGDS